MAELVAMEKFIYSKNRPVSLQELKNHFQNNEENVEELVMTLESSGKICHELVNEVTTLYRRPNLAITSPQPLVVPRNTPRSHIQLTPRRARPRTPLASSKLRQPFKSPLQQESPAHDKTSMAGHQEDICRLECRLEELAKEISELNKEYQEDELQQHIDKLHEYNEIKDVCQLILGKLAELEGRTIKSLHLEYGLDEED